MAATSRPFEDRSGSGNGEVGVVITTFFAVLFALGAIAAALSVDDSHPGYEIGAVMLAAFSVLNIVLAVRVGRASRTERR